MPLFELTSDRFEEVPPTSFQVAKIWERRDLQRILRDQIEVIDKDLMVVADEFSNWVHSDLRIDLLCIDRDANLVVIELKRDDRAGHSDLQAIHYAALAEGAKFDHIVEAYQVYRQRRHREDSSAPGLEAGQAEQTILDFLEWNEPHPEWFGNDVRIILVSSNFSKPLTTAAFWLRNKKIDIRCFRMVPYTLDETASGRLLVDVQQLVPLPEVADLTDRMADKEERRRDARAGTSSKDYRRFDLTVLGESFEHLPKRRVAYEIVHAAICKLGIPPQTIVEETTEGRRRKYRPILLPLDGHLGQSEFEAHLSETMPTLRPRYFTDEGDLIYAANQTWAFTNQWGLEMETFVQELAQRHPDLNVELSPSGDAGV